MERDSVVDVVIIGGGPIGLFAAFNCGMRGMSVKVIEASPELGGKVTRFYPEKYIYDIGGLPRISGEALVDNMISQAAKHEPEVITERIVERVKKSEDGLFRITTDKGETHYSKTVISCTGMGRYQPVLLDKENASEFEGEALHYMFNKPEKFYHKKVAIVSDHRIAVDWALALDGKAERVYVINSKSEFSNADAEGMEKLVASSAEVFYDSIISSVNGKNKQLNSVTLSPKGRSESKLNVDHLLVYLGIKFAGIPLDEWNIKSEKGRVVVNTAMESSLPGFYAAGDTAYYPHKSLLIANGYTEAITAVNGIARYLDSNAPSQLYSTVVYKNI